METLFNFIHVAVAIALILLILLQERSSGLSGAFGGSATALHTTRRGPEKLIFNSTIVLLIIFIGLSFLNLVV